MRLVPPHSHPVVVGIDPGTNAGCLSCLVNTETIVYKLPDTPVSFFGRIQEIHESYPEAYWFIEDVGRPRPGTQLDSVHTFSKHRGHLEMALIATGAYHRSRFVPPDVWMTRLWPAKDWPHGNESRQVKERKKFFHRLAMEQTGIKFPQYAGDGVCIALYGRECIYDK
jgi:hypothetical protein